MLYRFDCPDALTLGEYVLDLLEMSEHVRMAAHTLECHECQADLQQTRSYLAALTEVPQPIGARVRRVLASLFKPAGGQAYGGLRGNADSSTRMFQAEDVTLTIGPGQEPGTLIGLVVVDSVTPEAIAEHAVRLVGSDGVVVSSTLDDLGNFEFEQLAPGMYALEVDLENGLVVVEGLRVT